MEYIYHNIIVLIVATMVGCMGYGIFLAVLSIKNYIYAFSRSLIINDKSYIFEPNDDKDADAIN